MAEPLLSLSGLTKSYGAVTAVRAVDLEIAEGEVHAVIGPNGAGKTTLVAQIAGQVKPDAGAIRFAGRVMNGLGPAARTRLGLARSFQVTSLFEQLSAADNVALAVQAQSGRTLGLWRNARRDHRLRAPAEAMLQRVGLAEAAETRAGDLSHGAKRQLEVAVALALAPRLLLLDEPMAGLGPEEVPRMLDLLAGLKGTLTMLLIEHDMDTVFALADRITVLVQGETIATGAPMAIRADPLVRRAYLGEDDAAA